MDLLTIFILKYYFNIHSLTLIISQEERHRVDVIYHQALNYFIMFH